ncbi:hypothetical protein BC629DRAFT_1586704 [Irpex lacteus]|nr:hypothetical protein BC629DRAFT_1586704 [Irpex lacteus]
MAPVTTIARLHTKTLSRMSWSWVIWLVIACLSLIATAFLCVATRWIIAKRQAVRGGRPMENTLNPLSILVTHTQMTTPPLVTRTEPVDTKLDKSALPLLDLKPSQSVHISLRQVRSIPTGTIRIIPSTQDEDMTSYSLLQPPLIALTSRQPGALADILGYPTPYDEESVSVEHTPILSSVSEASSMEESLLGTPLPDTGLLLPQVLGSEDMEEDCPMTIKKVYTEVGGLNIGLESQATVTISRPSSWNPELEVIEHAASKSGPNIVRTPEQVSLMHYYGLDYIDARIAIITGHTPSHRSLYIQSHAVEASSASGRINGRPRRPVSLPITASVQMGPTMKAKRKTARFTPPRMASQFDASFLRRTTISSTLPRL